MTNAIKQNKMGSTPIPKLLTTMSLPAIFSMLILALYNIVDSIFVAQVSQDALLAVSIAFPLQMILTAFALGIGVGTNSIVARRLGENKRDDAEKFAQTGLFMAIIASAVFMLLGSFLPRLFMQGFSQSESVISMGNGYLSICMVFCFGMMIEMVFSKTLQATGNMIVPMVSQLIGAITNIILDPILIFTCKLGVNGAGIATVTGQIFAMTFSILMSLRKSNTVKVFFHKFKVSFKHIGIIAKVGLPVMVMNAIGGFIILIMNVILGSFSQDAITVLGIYFKLQSFVFMPVFGLCQGALPIMAYNYGANNKKRFRKTLFLSCAVSLTIMILGLILFQVAPELMLSLFKAEESMMEMGATALRAISWCFVPAALGIVFTSAYQALGYGFTSLVMSLLRQLVFILPFAIIFGKVFGLNGIWWCYPLAEILTVSFFVPLLFVFSKKAFNRKEQSIMLENTLNQL